MKLKVGLMVVMISFFMVQTSLAKDYDFYVDVSADYNGKGEKDSPFNNIKDALKKVGNKGGDIFIREGIYKDNITLGRNTHLYGEANNKSIIYGTVVMEDGSSLKQMTIVDGGNAIIVDKGANIKVEECILRDFGMVGIKATEGSGKVEITKSKIYRGKGKGLYIERGRRLKLKDNQIFDNKEEGVDIRDKVTGEIVNNKIYNNGESGIEILVSQAKVNISNNKLKNNGSSGLAVQFYKDHKETGNIKINNNQFYDNSNFGLDCRSPQGGRSGKDYWKKSITRSNNVFHLNKKGDISFRCDLKENNSKNKKAEENKLEHNEKNKIEEKTEMKEEKNKEENKEEIKRIKEAEKKRQEHIKNITEWFLTEDEDSHKLEEKIKEQENNSKIRIFFFGYDQDVIKQLLIKSEEVDNEIKKINKLLEENLLMEKVKEKMLERIKKEERINNSRKMQIRDMQKKYGLFGWFKKIF